MLLELALAAVLQAAENEAAGADDDDVIVATPEERHTFWVLDRATVGRNVKPKDVPRGAVGCSAVSFIIEKNGTTSTFKLLRSMPDGQWDDLSRKVVAGLRFTPGDKNPKPDAVYTYLTISFAGRDEKALGTHVRPLVQLDDRMNELCEVKGVQLGQ
jgi:hypothetical protein